MSKCTRLVDVGRRQFLRGGAAATATVATAAAGMVPRSADARASLALVDYPVHSLANEKDLRIDEPLFIHYPDADSPGVLLKLGTRVPGGVGRDGDIIGFSILCPHKGYSLLWTTTDRTLNCPGHYSRFDAENGGQQVWGHATQNLPQFILRVDPNGDIVAEGVDELIYGRLSNVLQS